MLDRLASPTRRNARRARWLVQRHPASAALWCGSMVAMAAATALSAPYEATLARWALWLALVAVCTSMVATARWVIARMTHIVALWEEDVPLHNDDGTSNLFALPARHRGQRARENA